MIVTSLTYRQALDEARRTYGELRRALLIDADDTERDRIDRVSARGIAALNKGTGSNASLLPDANRAFAAYMRSAADGDAEAKFGWLKMMPRVVAEVTARVEQDLVFQPVQWADYGVFLGTTLQHSIDLVATAKDVLYTFELTTRTREVANWRFTLPATGTWFATKVAPPRAELPEEPAPNRARQPALALAA